MRAFVLLVFLAGCRSSAPVPLRVAAASDLTEAFTELGARFEAETKTKVVFSFGSSGLLAKQLAEGAPFDVFAAANASFVDDVIQAGACDGATKQKYARGRLAAWSLAGALPSLESIADAGNRRIALANPEHAPYGRAAKEALEHAGLWKRLEPRVVYAENVRQALQLAQTGNAEVALVAYSNVINRTDGVKLLIDPSLYAPIEQSLVRCQRGAQPEAAKRFLEFLVTDESRALLERSGFTHGD
ncbi:MAG: molybdate ABC transporter substrate-binding protein [Archangium sp.]|nr:molybdate ABC transporter substrate-binding protein [Archangium sp.]